MNCPRCDSEFFKIDSNREMQLSDVRCLDCGFSFQAPVTEECIVRMCEVINPEDTSDVD